MIGVDSSAGMLARAREKVPQGEFHEADLHELPLADDSVDLVVCAIALVHLADIEGPFREFARVLRPGGHLVVSNQSGLNRRHHLPGPDPRAPRASSDTYPCTCTAPATISPVPALPLGFQVLRCEEPRVPSPLLDEEGRLIDDGERLPPQDPDDPPSIWGLHAEAIDATNAAWRWKLSSITWHFQLAR